MPRGTTDLAALMKGHPRRRRSVDEHAAGAGAAAAPCVDNALPQAAAWRYARHLLQALAHVHANGVVHNDVKLENVVLSADKSIAQLMDFGLSSFAVENPDDQIASFVGTYAYMAPEVLNQRARGAAADLWSFGVALFKMLTGRMPFRSGTLGELLADIEAETYTAVMADAVSKPATSLNVLALFAQLFRRDPAQRPTAADLLESDWFGCVGVGVGVGVGNTTGTAADTATTTTDHASSRAKAPFPLKSTPTPPPVSPGASEATDDSYDGFIPAAARLVPPTLTASEQEAAAAAAAAAAALLPPVRLGKVVSHPYADEIDRLEMRLKTARALQSPAPRPFAEARESIGRLAKEQQLRRHANSDSTLLASSASSASAHLFGTTGGGAYEDLDSNGKLRRRAVSASDIARAAWPKELLEKVHAERVRLRQAITAQTADLATTKRERKVADAVEARAADNPRPRAARHTAKRALLQRRKSPKLHRTKIQTLSNNNLPALSPVPRRPFHS